jgi:hypothetical protein
VLEAVARAPVNLPKREPLRCRGCGGRARSDRRRRTVSESPSSRLETTARRKLQRNRNAQAGFNGSRAAGVSGRSCCVRAEFQRTASRKAADSAIAPAAKSSPRENAHTETGIANIQAHRAPLLPARESMRKTLAKNDPVLRPQSTIFCRETWQRDLARAENWRLQELLRGGWFSTAL